MEKTSMEDSNGLEDGELEFESSFDDIYTPLERPTCSVPVAAKTVEESDDNESFSSSDGNSSDGERSRPKIKQRSLSKLSSKDVQEGKKKNFNIWKNVLQAETVSTTLTDCNLDEYQKRIRGLVPYKSMNYYNNKEFSHGQINSSAGKRNYSGCYVGEKKVFKDNNFDQKRGDPKIIQPLNDTSQESDEILAKELADKLSEMKWDLILRAIQISGRDQIISIFEETRKVEEEGGMLIMNGSRRRTSGGVFFYLLKTSDHIPQVQLKEIFELDKRATTAQKKKVTRRIKKDQEMKVGYTLQNASGLKVS